MKLKALLFIIGGLLMCALTSITTYFGLSSAGVVKGDQINLSYSLESYKKTYDGVPCVANTETNPYTLDEGQLLDGHSEYFYYHGSLTNVGTVEVTADVRILDRDGYDVTSSYLIKVTPATLQVLTRPITVAVDSSKLYLSGSDVTTESGVLYPISGSLASGDKLVPYITFNTESGTVDITSSVFDVNGIEKTNNYDIIYDNPSDIVVSKLPLKIAPLSASKTYDGTPLVFSEYVILSGTLAQNHSLVIDYGEGITNVFESGYYSIPSGGVRIVDAANQDVTSSYNLDYRTAANLKINPIDINVTLKGLNKTYDGSGFNVPAVTDLYTYKLPNELSDSNFTVGVLDSEQLLVSINSLTTAASYEIKPKFVLYNDNENVDVKNYTISHNEAYAVIEQCAVHVSYKQFSAECAGFGYEISSPFDIIQNYYLDNTASETAQTLFEKMKLEFLEENLVKETFRSFKTAGRHWYKAKFAIVPNDPSVTENEAKNFKVIYENQGSIDVTSINLIIYGKNEEVYFDTTGQYPAKDSNDPKDSYDSCIGLLTGQTLTVDYSAHPYTDADDEKYIYEEDDVSITLKDRTGTVIDISQYYTLTFYPGSLKINRRKLYVWHNTISTVKEEYNTLSYFTNKKKELVSAVQGSPKITLVDSKSASPDLTYIPYLERGLQFVYEWNEEDLTHVGDVYFALSERDINANANFEIILRDAYFTITPRTVELNWYGGITKDFSYQAQNEDSPKDYSYKEFTYNSETQAPILRLGRILLDDEVEFNGYYGKQVDANLKEFNKDATDFGLDNEEYLYIIKPGKLSNSNYQYPEFYSCYYRIEKQEFKVKVPELTIVYGQEFAMAKVKGTDRALSYNLDLSFEGAYDDDEGIILTDPGKYSPTSYYHHHQNCPGDTNAAYYVEHANGNSFRNYTITSVSSKINIEKCPVYLSREPFTIAYGDDLVNSQTKDVFTFYSDPEKTHSITSLTVYDNALIELNISNNISQYAELESDYFAGAVIGKSFDVNIKSLAFEGDNGTRLSKCYELVCDGVTTVTVNEKKTLNINLPAKYYETGFTYTGEYLTIKAEHFTYVINNNVGGLLSTDSVLDYTFNFVDWCSSYGVKNNLEHTCDIHIVNALGADVTSNYDLSNAHLTIKGTKLNKTSLVLGSTITQLSYYSGIVADLNNLALGFFSVNRGLCSGDYISNLDVSAPFNFPTNEGATVTVTVSCDFKVLTESGKEVTSFYDFEENIGKIIVTNCPTSDN